MSPSCIAYHIVTRCGVPSALIDATWRLRPASRSASISSSLILMASRRPAMAAHYPWATFSIRGEEPRSIAEAHEPQGRHADARRLVDDVPSHARDPAGAPRSIGVAPRRTADLPNLRRRRLPD